MQAICNEIEESLKKHRVRTLHEEGNGDSGWMLYDYGDVVVHVFSPAERDFYQFDELWHKGIPIVRIQ